MLKKGILVIGISCLLSGEATGAARAAAALGTMFGIRDRSESTEETEAAAESELTYDEATSAEVTGAKTHINFFNKYSFPENAFRVTIEDRTDRSVVVRTQPIISPLSFNCLTCGQCSGSGVVCHGCCDGAEYTQSYCCGAFLRSPEDKKEANFNVLCGLYRVATKTEKEEVDFFPKNVTTRASSYLWGLYVAITKTK